MLGRARVVNDGITCDFTASGIEFYAYVDGEISISLECSAETYFTVFVDGERYRDRYKAEAGFNTITFDTYVKGLHEIKFYKQTEPQHSTATLNSIECYFTGKYAEDTEKQAAWEYYINMCKETDNMIRDLLKELEKMVKKDK